MLKLKEMPKKQRAALGQGLDALLPADGLFDEKVSERDIKQLTIDSLIPNPDQPRRIFPEESLADLSQSIKEKGVIQPIIVRHRQTCCAISTNIRWMKLELHRRRST